MANKLYEEQDVQNIANAIREKTGESTKFRLSDMANAISNIQAGGSGDENYIAFIERSTDTPILPEGLMSIGEYAFYNCKNLALTKLPSGITSIGEYAFYNCENLALTKLPEGLKNIDSSVFSNCDNLVLIELPEGLKGISSHGFGYCKNLSTLTFNSTPSIVATSSFSNCPNLTTIRVPWSEGAVSGAPWGATNATIIYNYTGEE